MNKTNNKSRTHLISVRRDKNNYDKLVHALPRSEPVAIIDSGADRCMFGKGWKFLSPRKIERDGFSIIKCYSSSQKVSKPCTAVTTLLDACGNAKAILKMHQAIVPEVQTHESLFANDQLNWAGVMVEAKPKVWGGNQRLKHDDWEIDVLWDGSTKFVKIRYPTKEELQKLPTYILTKNEPYDPQQLLQDMLKSKGLKGKFKTMIRRLKWLPNQLKEWQHRLCSNEEVVRQTFKNTTQLVPTVENESRMYPRMQYKAQFPFLRPKFLGERFFCDTLYYGANGKQRGQLYIGHKSQYTYFYPLGKKEGVVNSLNAFLTDVGRPSMLVSDSAQEEVLSVQWKTILNKYKIKGGVTEAGKQHQNKVERCVQTFKHRATLLTDASATYDRHYDPYLFGYICDIHNLTANKVVNFKTPHEALEGETPDISHLRFKWWEPIWYMEPDTKYPAVRMRKGRFLGIAKNTGHALTYKVLTVPDNPKTRAVVLSRSVVAPRELSDTNYGFEVHKRIKNFFPKTVSIEGNNATVQDSRDANLRGREEAHTALNSPSIEQSQHRNSVKRKRDELSHEEQDNHNDFILHPGNKKNKDPPIYDLDVYHGRKSNKQRSREKKALSDQELNEIGVDNQVETESEDPALINSFNLTADGATDLAIVRHRFSTTSEDTDDPEDVGIMFQIDLAGEKLWVTYKDLKIDAPNKLASYLLSNRRMNGRRSHVAMNWADTHVINMRRLAIKLIQTEGEMIMQNSDFEYSKDISMECLMEQHENLINIRRVAASGKPKKTKKKSTFKRVKYGIKIPKNTREAYEFDKENGNHLWAEAIKKEIDALMSYKVFQFIKRSDISGLKRDDYQFAPLRMIFEVKQDLRRKARLVIGGHVVDPMGQEVFASVMKQSSTRILLIIAQANGLDVLTGDIGNAYLYAKTREKIYTFCDEGFLNAGWTDSPETPAIVVQALYGLATSGNRWHALLSDTLRSQKWRPTKGDPNVWYRRHGEMYEYIGTHTDDLIVVSKRAREIFDELEKLYIIKKIEKPSFYLGCDYFPIKRNGLDTYQIGSKTYVTEAIKRVAHVLEIDPDKIHIKNRPMADKYQPELDSSPSLNDEEHSIYQKLIGTGLWVNSIGRMDIAYAIASLSRFSAAPKKGHLEALIEVFGYLKKFPDKRIEVNSTYEQVGVLVQPECGQESFIEQYPDAREEIPANLPKPLGKPLKASIWFDANHAHDKVTRRSITCIIAMVGKTPVTWYAKRQGAIEGSTYGAEFVASKTACEELIALRYTLRSFGVEVEGPSPILGDNLGMMQTISYPDAKLKKKHLSISYHLCRECVAADIAEPRKVQTETNRADPLTKPLGPNKVKNSNSLLFIN